MSSPTQEPQRSSSVSTTASCSTMDTLPIRTRCAPSSPQTPTMTFPMRPRSKPTTFSLLLSLPREIRERIYGFTLTSSIPHVWPPRPDKAPARNIGVALLRANRQIYSEAAPVLYASNAFLFGHPSDATIFRVVASEHSNRIQTVYIRVRDRDVRIWASWMQSKSADRGMSADLPQLKQLWIFLRVAPPQLQNPVAMLPHIHPAVAAARIALAQHIESARHNIAENSAGLARRTTRPLLNHPSASAAALFGLETASGAGPGAMTATGGTGVLVGGAGATTIHYHPPTGHHHLPAAHHPPAPASHVPPPPPPAPQAPQTTNWTPTYIPTGTFTYPHPPVRTDSHFNHFDREKGIESLCAAMRETRRNDIEVRIVANMRVPKAELRALVREWGGNNGILDVAGDARTSWRWVESSRVVSAVAGSSSGQAAAGGIREGVKVCLEVSGM